MRVKNLKKLIFILIPIMSVAILIQNPVMVALASPAANSNVSSFAGNSPMGGNEGFGTGGPEVIAKLLSEGNTSNPDSTTNNNIVKYNIIINYYYKCIYICYYNNNKNKSNQRMQRNKEITLVQFRSTSIYNQSVYDSSCVSLSVCLLKFTK